MTRGAQTCPRPGVPLGSPSWRTEASASQPRMAVLQVAGCEIQASFPTHLATRWPPAARARLWGWLTGHSPRGGRGQHSI